MRKTLRTKTNYVARIEEFAQALLDLATEEKRLLKTLSRVQVMKDSLIAGLAKVAKAAANVQK